jgi:imidazolonepropionase-like amidohydrolase
MSKDSTLEPGKLADIVLLGGNPMDGLWSMLKVRAIIKGGVVLYEKK